MVSKIVLILNPVLVAKSWGNALYFSKPKNEITYVFYSPDVFFDNMFISNYMATGATGATGATTEIQVQV